jgi:hypothetical protein
MHRNAGLLRWHKSTLNGKTSGGFDLGQTSPFVGPVIDTALSGEMVMSGPFSPPW